MVNLIFSKAEKGFTWMDVVSPTPEELQAIAVEYGLHATSLEDCLDPKHQPKYEEIENLFFIILRAYDDNCSPGSDNVWQLTRKVAIFIGDDFILTVHRCALDFIQQLQAKWQTRNQLSNDDREALLLEIMRGVILSFAPVLEDLEENIDDFEKGIFSNEIRQLLYRQSTPSGAGCQ